MSKHREVVEHLKAIANHCDLYIGENKTCCGCVFALGWTCAVRELVSDTQGVIEIVEKRVEELEVNERVKKYKDLEKTRNICRKFADEIRGLGEKQ